MTAIVRQQQRTRLYMNHQTSGSSYLIINKYQLNHDEIQLHPPRIQDKHKQHVDNDTSQYGCGYTTELQRCCEESGTRLQRPTH